MNHRIRKKKMKYNILHMKPNEVVVIRFPMGKFDIDELNSAFKCFKEIVPETCSFCFMADYFAIKEMSKEEAYGCLEKFEKFVHKNFPGEENEK